MSSAFDEAIVMNPAHSGNRTYVGSNKGTLSVTHLSQKLMWLDKEVSSLKMKLTPAKATGNFTHLMKIEDMINKACVELKGDLEVALHKVEEDSSPRGERHKIVKIHRDFVNVMQRFNNISRELADISYSSANELRESFHSMHDHNEEKGVQFAQMDSDSHFNDMEEYLIEERLKDAAEIAKKTAEINALFTDVSNLVKQQGADIEIAAQNIDTSLQSTVSGVDQLHKAQAHQKATGSCLKYLVGFVVLVCIL